MMNRCLNLLCAIVIFMGCKKQNDNPYLKWQGSWKLIHYSYYTYFKQQSGGPGYQSYYTELADGQFKRGHYFERYDTVCSCWKGYNTLISNNFTENINSKIENNDSFFINENYTLSDSSGKITDILNFSNGLKLRKDIFNYYPNFREVYSWKLHGDTIEYHDENQHPGSSGGKYYRYTRIFKKIK